MSELCKQYLVIAIPYLVVDILPMDGTFVFKKLNKGHIEFSMHEIYIIPRRYIPPSLYTTPVSY